MLVKYPSVLLVGAYDKEEEFRQNDLEGAISLGEFERRRLAAQGRERDLLRSCPHDEGATRQAAALLSRRLYQRPDSTGRRERLERSGLHAGGLIGLRAGLPFAAAARPGGRSQGGAKH